MRKIVETFIFSPDTIEKYFQIDCFADHDIDSEVFTESEFSSFYNNFTLIEGDSGEGA